MGGDQKFKSQSDPSHTHSESGCSFSNWSQYRVGMAGTLNKDQHKFFSPSFIFFEFSDTILLYRNGHNSIWSTNEIVRVFYRHRAAQSSCFTIFFLVHNKVTHPNFTRYNGRKTLRFGYVRISYFRVW